MLQCPSCSDPVAEQNRFCPTCGLRLGPSGTATVQSRIPPERPRGAGTPAASPIVFGPGRVLLGRYRIVSLVGRGGMGEIYRADDLTLDHPVALKFLPAALRFDRARLDRLLAEVRSARQVTHPVVCRVHDIGEAEGRHFISMEYVDGEDLHSLLRRIGRLPQPKALEVAFKLCAGLIAVHDCGLLHRDLKPANIMLDARGRVRLMDFGLAALQGAIATGDVRSGTPAYMSPEQSAGWEVTVRSDIYALGLVLYELFAGYPAFDGTSLEELARQHREVEPRPPSALAPDVDPAVDRLIVHCLEKDPRKRPSSVLAVAAGLPGGDPLSVALAAGITPSPEVVAAAGRGRGLTVAAARGLVAVVALALVAALIGNSREQLPWTLPPIKAAPVLEDRARELIRRLALSAPLTDEAAGLVVDEGYFEHEGERTYAPGFREALASGRPPALHYWYRAGPRPLVAYHVTGEPSWIDPPPVLPGMTGVRLDTQGRLLAFYSVPVERAPPSQGEVDWSPFFAEAGLDPTLFRATPPERTPPFFCDGRAAWEGSFPGRADLPLRIEAATARGRPVFFALLAPWTPPDYGDLSAEPAPDLAFMVVATVVIAACLGFAGWTARRNLREGRGDRRGAFRLGVFTLGVELLGFVVRAHHVPHLDSEVEILGRAASLSLLTAAVLWLFYLAIEPYARRHFPRMLASWANLLGGGHQDPLVGRDVLIGVTWGALLAAIGPPLKVAVWSLAARTAPPMLCEVTPLLGLGPNLGFVAEDLFFGMLMGLGCLLLLLLFRLIFRRESLAAMAVAALFAVLGGANGPWEAWAVAVNFAYWSALVLLLVKGGLLVFSTSYFLSNLTTNSLPTSIELFGRAAVPNAVLLAVYAGILLYAWPVAAPGASPVLGPETRHPRASKGT